MSYPGTLSPARPSGLMPSKSRFKRREPSGVFTLFSAPQIKQFKEAFSLIDQDGDGIVSEADLKTMFSSLGVNPSRSTIQTLVDARPREDSSRMSILPSETGKPRGVDFTMFLTMMGEHLLQLDPEADLLEAFACFDENDDGKVKCDEIRKWLTEVGDRMDASEIDRLLKGPFTDRQGYFNYREWAKALRVEQDEDEEGKQ
ncbi:EF-hand protein [Clavulina sp. PMI_390]|nr:EF-hand protein [Clavulina sp. PMI_390]